MKKSVSVCAMLAAMLPFFGHAEFAYEFTATVNYQGAETLVDFPVLVRLPGLVTSRMRADGLDIRFYAEDGETELAHEFEKIAYKDLSLCWVKVPALSAGTKLVIRFGDPDFDTPAAGTSTWSSYIGVWHLNDYNKDSVPDATGRSTGSGNSTLASVSGKVATATRINGRQWTTGSNPTHRISIANKGALATDGQLTVSWWMKPNSSAAMPRTIDLPSYLFQMKNASNHLLWDVHYQLYDGAAPTFSIGTHEANNGEWSEVVVTDADEKVNDLSWRYLVCTFENAAGGETATGSIFTDGALLMRQEDLYPLQSAGTGGSLSIGAGWGSGDYNYCGSMDEVRLRAVVSSADWIKTERDSVDDREFVMMPDDLPEVVGSVTRRIVATEEEKEGDWADAAVAGDDAAAVIQSALDASLPGDTVLLKAGTYVLTSELSLANVTHNGVRLRSDDGAGNLARETTLLVGGYPATQNRLIKCAAQTVTVEGFTFTNGYVDATCGGAIWLDKTDAGTRILNCDFLGNTAWWAAKETASSSPGSDCVEGAGGAVFVEGAGIISNCLFRGNRGFSGAGVQSKSALKVVSPVMDVPSVTRCSFTENSTHGPGNVGPKYGSGAGVCAYGAAVVDHSTFVSNHAFSARGDGIACSGNEGLSVSNCTFEGNSCIYRGTGAYIPKAVLLASKSVSCTMIGENPARCPRLISGDVLDGHTYSNCSFTAGSDIYRMRNCLFVGNKVASGIIMNGSAGQNSYIDNCTFIGNTVCFSSSAEGARTNFVNNCVFLGNGTIHHAVKDIVDAKGCYFIMTNCVYAGKFTDKPNDLPSPVTSGCLTDLTLPTAKFFAAGRGDLHLRAASPLLNAGVALGWMEGAFDRDGKPRVVGGAPDIGCYERQGDEIDPPDNLCTRAVATEADKTGEWKNAVVGLQAAVDAAYDYEPLYVKAGTYALTAPVTVKNKAISFIGEGKDTTILDGQGASRCLVAILDSNAAGDLTFDGFTFTNGCAGTDTSAGNYNARGGCVYLSCAESFRRITLSDCRVTGGRSLQPLTDAGKVPDKKNFCGAGAYAVQYCAFKGCVFDDNIASNTEASAVGIESIGTAGVRGSGTIFTDCIVTNCQNIGKGGSDGSFCAGIQDWGSGCVWIENTAFADLTGKKYFIALNLKGGAMITNCVFRNCDASTSAISLGGSTSRLCGCWIERCSGNSIIGDLPVDRCVFCNNSGTIWFKTSPVDVHNCLFVSNMNAIISTHDTGDKRGLFENCTFVDNNGDNSSVVSMQGAKTNNKFTFVNCILWGNTKDVNCTDKKWQETDIIAYTNCLVEAYTTALPETHEGCIVGLNPRFVDPASGNYRLKSSSPLRDKALTLDWMTEDAIDLDGKPRRISPDGKAYPDSLPDIGCYECDIPKPGLLLMVW